MIANRMINTTRRQSFEEAAKAQCTATSKCVGLADGFLARALSSE